MLCPMKFNKKISIGEIKDYMFDNHGELMDIIQSMIKTASDCEQEECAWWDGMEQAQCCGFISLARITHFLNLITQCNPLINYKKEK